MFQIGSRINFPCFRSYNKLIPYFNKLGLSPITIPQKKSQYCDEVFFPNPLKYVTGESVELLRDTDVLQTESFNDTE